MPERGVQAKNAMCRLRAWPSSGRRVQCEARTRTRTSAPEGVWVSARRPQRSNGTPDWRLQLALRVLRRLACSLEPVLLPLLHARVTSQEPGLTQWKAVAFRIELKQSSRDAVADRAGLTGYAAALDLDLGVVRALGPG